MGQQPNRDRRKQPPGQPPGQPPWGSSPPPGYPPNSYPPPPGYPPTGYPGPGSPPPGHSPAGRGGAQPPGSRIPPVQARPRPRRRARRKLSRQSNTVLLVIAAVLVIGAIVGALSGHGNSPKSAAVATTSASSTGTQVSSSSKAITAAQDACYKRPASGSIYVRTVTPGVSPRARRLGGERDWDHVTSKCLTSVQYTIAIARLSAGNCTQVGYVAANPGYDVNATTASPLTHVAAQAGPACRAVARPAPAQTTPAPAAAPSPAQTTTPAPAPAPPVSTAPVSTAPASCYPLSDEGTCYEPGEYCRDDDHGASGVARDGEAITCEDNDGWRWEPA